MSTQAEVNVIDAELELLDAALLETTRTELRQSVNKARQDMVDMLFDAGVDTIYLVYDFLHCPAQSFTGYQGAVHDMLDGSEHTVALANMMNEAARAIGKEETYTAEHAAQSVAKALDGLLFGFEVEILKNEKTDQYRIVGNNDTWKLRVRHYVELKTGYVKKAKKTTIPRAIKQFGYSALVEARQRYFNK